MSPIKKNASQEWRQLSSWKGGSPARIAFPVRNSSGTGVKRGQGTPSALAEVYNASASLIVNKSIRRTCASITVDVGNRFRTHRGMVSRAPSGARGQGDLR